MKFPLKTVAACAVTAMAVGATSATAASLVTSSQIKDGAVHLRDLSPGVQEKLAKTGTHGAAGTTPGAAGTNGVDGVNGSKGDAGTSGANGAAGVNGLDGKDGLNGAQGAKGDKGKDADQFDRIVGSCDSDPNAEVGEVSVADGMARLAVPNGQAWAQVKTFPKNLKVSDISNLSFKANASDVGQSYLKVTTTNQGSIVFDASSQRDENGDLIAEKTGEMVTYDVKGSTVRWNDDAGRSDQLTWQEMLTMGANKHVKSISITAGCALGDAGETFVDELTVNNEVLDFS